MFSSKLSLIFLVFGMIEVSMQAEDFWNSETFLRKLKEIRASDLNALNYNNFPIFNAETTTQQQQQKPTTTMAPKTDSIWKLNYNQQAILNMPSFLSFVKPQPVIQPPQPIVAFPFGFPVQQPVVSNTGDLILETVIYGIPFNCFGRPTGHYRDDTFCDIFHACVHGYQRKTYACPVVGERTYFNEVTQRCDFVSQNPGSCQMKAFYKK